MVGAFFFICTFLITVGGLLLFRPIQVNRITDYSLPAAIEERKKITIKMARFLEKNPEITKQQRLTSLPLASSEKSNLHFEIIFQGATQQFQSITEYDQWIYKNVTDDPINFLKQLHSNDNPELYLETLKKVGEISNHDSVNEQIKNAYLELAKNLITNPDGYHQQLMQKAVQSYLDLEKDKTIGKKNADEILNH